MKKIVQFVLKQYTRRILRKYQPKVVGITGSVGKTSAKEAIAAVLKFHHSVRENIKNYNNELGVPLSVIGVESGGRSPLGWLKVFYHATKLLVFKMPYPEILVLEMGADKPGDIEYLTEVAPVDIGVMTAVGAAHLHEFKSVDNVLKEKAKIVTKITKGRAVMNYDDERVRSIIPKVKTNVTTYGFEQGADVRALEISFVGMDDAFCEAQSEWDCKQWGTSFKVVAQGSTVPFFLPHSLGKANVYAALAAIAVGLAQGMNMIDISESLRQYRSPRGRLQLLAGIKGSMIIDDTYNASPLAVDGALDVMEAIALPPGGRRIIFLGAMLELGDTSVAEHTRIGRRVALMDNVELFVCVGSEAHSMYEAALEAGMDPQKVAYHETSHEVGNTYQNLINNNDLILIKGSQGARMERVVKELMEDPLRAHELLVRQTEEWRNR